jgi:hypothetical protein
MRRLGSGWGIGLQGESYVPIEVNARGWRWSEVLGAWLGVSELPYRGWRYRWLRLYDVGGRLVPTGEELAAAERELRRSRSVSALSKRSDASSGSVDAPSRSVSGLKPNGNAPSRSVSGLKPNGNAPNRNACCASRQRAEAERQRAEQERQRAEQAERRLAELEAELKRLRSDG